MVTFRKKRWNKTARIEEWDYGSNARYYIRIGIKRGENYIEGIGVTQNFASLSGGEPCIKAWTLSEIGQVIIQYWNEIPDHFPFVKLQKMILSPNKLHAILRFEKPGFKSWKTNSFGPQSRNLASVIRGFKAAVKKYATLHYIEFEWEDRYDETIINSESEEAEIDKIFSQFGNLYNQRYVK